MVDAQKVREELSQRRVELESELGRLTEPPEEGASVGFGKRVGDGTTEAVERLATTATARSIAASIADVDRALARLDEGTYGMCEVCGLEIPAARIEALPATTRCVTCASGTTL
ncbi:MAG TPA: TraR/DksA C4-type zinc finger protein [Acidimicrobiia bacterium]|nr:TraR/DksA C4-type zinc finger protein [Acidimicrobiia bacterium]